MSTRSDISPFAADVYNAVKRIPEGRVATYAQIALMSGHRGAARAVGNALHANPFFGEVPCHRVVSASGAPAERFGFGGADVQRAMLRAEGVECGVDGRVPLDIYQYRG